MSDQGFDGGRNLREKNNERRNTEQDRQDMRSMTVTTVDGNKGDDTGVGAIVKAFVKNPGGAVQIVLFIGSLYGVYYAIQGEITDVRAAQITNFEKLNTKIEGLVTEGTAAQLKLDTLYSRGDTRYTNIIAKLSAHDVDIAKIVASLDFVVDQFKTGSNVERSAPPHIRPSVVPAIP